MDHRTCRRHFTNEQLAVVADLERRGVAIELPRTDTGEVSWPYGPDIDVASRTAMVEWAERHRVKRASGYQRLHCVCWPTSKRLRRCECGLNESISQRRDDTWDHFTHWRARAGGRAVLVVQPYHLTDDGQAILDQWHARDDVHIEVRDDSWYGTAPSSSASGTRSSHPRPLLANWPGLAAVGNFP